MVNSRLVFQFCATFPSSETPDQKPSNDVVPTLNSVQREDDRSNIKKCFHANRENHEGLSCPASKPAVTFVSSQTSRDPKSTVKEHKNRSVAAGRNRFS